MQRINTSFVAAVITLVSMGGAAKGRDIVFKIDPVHSSVIFSVKHSDVSYTIGRFNHVSGEIVADDLYKPTMLEITAEVKTKSLDTNNKERDKKLRARSFFHAKKNPKIKFKTTKARRIEENKYELTGDLSLRGVTKEITVVFEMIGLKKVAPLKRRLGGQTTFSIKRSDFGMDHMLKGIGDEVTITVNLEAEFNIPPAG